MALAIRSKLGVTIDVFCMSGLASELKTKEELITLLSVAIFTSTAQHAATNNGQVTNTSHFIKFIYTLNILLNFHYTECRLPDMKCVA